MIAETAIAALEAQLDAAHAALRAGQLDALDILNDKTGALILRLAPTSDKAALMRLKAKAARNAACLQAAARGLRAARRRIEEVQTARQGLGTYDSKGKRAGLVERAHQLTHRA